MAFVGPAFPGRTVLVTAPRPARHDAGLITVTIIRHMKREEYSVLRAN